MKEFKIFEENMENFEKKIKTLQRKSLKIGNGNVGFEKVGESFEKVNGINYKMIHVIITGAEAPRINGWEFVATIIHSGEKNILNIIPTFSGNIPEIYRFRSSICDHCESNRYRKDTYLLYNAENKEFKQVGKSCLKDFLGHKTPEQIAKYGEYLFRICSIDWEDYSGYNVPNKYTELTEWLEMSVAVINKQGYTSKQKALEELIPSTSELVHEQIYNSRSLKYNQMIDVQDKDRKQAKEIIEYLKTMNPKSNYEKNLQIIANEKYTEKRFYGYVTSMVVFYNKEMDKLKSENKVVKSEYFGSVKDKVELSLTIEKRISFDGIYGITSIHIMSDAEGRQFTWKTTSRTLEEGKTMRIKATIKEHTEYNGIKQTALTRLKEV